LWQATPGHNSPRAIHFVFQMRVYKWQIIWQESGSLESIK